MSMCTLVVILLAGTIGFLAGRGPIHPLRAWVPLFAVSSSAAEPPAACSPRRGESLWNGD
jgi:hypothetical protein